jgi:hypothetical protein
LHVVEVMIATYSTRCLFKLSADQSQKAGNVCREHRDAPIAEVPSRVAGVFRGNQTARLI